MDKKLEGNKIPDIRPGDIIRVHQKIIESGKEREQAFEGVVIKRSGGKAVSASFIVRKISQGIGVERKFLFYSPFLVKIQVKKRSKVRRADLSYLRDVLQVKKKLKDRKIEPFEESLVKEVKEVPTPSDQDVGEVVPMAIGTTASIGKQKEKEKKEKAEEKPNDKKTRI